MRADKHVHADTHGHIFRHVDKRYRCLHPYPQLRMHIHIQAHVLKCTCLQDIHVHVCRPMIKSACTCTHMNTVPHAGQRGRANLFSHLQNLLRAPGDALWLSWAPGQKCQLHSELARSGHNYSFSLSRLLKEMSRKMEPVTSCLGDSTGRVGFIWNGT